MPGTTVTVVTPSPGPTDFEFDVTFRAAEAALA